MKQSIQQWQSKIDALEVRERGLLLLAAAALLYLLWNGLVQSPIDSGNKQLSTQISALQTQLKALKSEELTLTVMANVDPDATKKRRIDTLQNDIIKLDDALAELSHGLVAADSLAKVLEDVLLRSTDLTLLKVQTLPVQALELATADTVKAAANSAELTQSVSAGVFKHSVLIRVEGDYFELLGYLQSLEQLSWRFYWDQLNYNVADYPRAVIDVRVYTLSAEEGLIGV